MLDTRTSQKIGLGRALLHGACLITLMGLTACSASYLAGDVQPNEDMGAPTPDFATLQALERQFDSGVGATALAVADLNKDQHADAAVANGIAGTVSVFLRLDGSGSMTPSATYAVGRGPSAIGTIDLDGDSQPDLVVANAADNTLSTLISKGQPSGAYVVGPTYGPIQSPNAIAVGDVTGDGKPDVVVSSAGSDQITVLQNLQQDGLLTRVGNAFSGGRFVYGLALVPPGGPPGTKPLDLAVVQAADDRVGLFRNNGSGMFAAVAGGVQLPQDTTPVAIVAADVDGNGQGASDLAIVGHGAGTLALALALGNGTFEPHSIAIAARLGAVAQGRLDSDGVPDWVVAEPDGDRVHVLLGADIQASWKAGGTGRPTVRAYAAAGLPSAVALGDVDGDGTDEVLVVCREQGALRVLRGVGK